MELSYAYGSGKGLNNDSEVPNSSVPWREVRAVNAENQMRKVMGTQGERTIQSQVAFLKRKFKMGNNRLILCGSIMLWASVVFFVEGCANKRADGGCLESYFELLKDYCMDDYFFTTITVEDSGTEKIACINIQDLWFITKSDSIGELFGRILRRQVSIKLDSLNRVQVHLVESCDELEAEFEIDFQKAVDRYFHKKKLQKKGVLRDATQKYCLMKILHEACYITYIDDETGRIGIFSEESFRERIESIPPGLR